jgi:hypothetical protein
LNQPEFRIFIELARLFEPRPQVGFQIFVLQAVFLHQRVDSRQPLGLIVLAERHGNILRVTTISHKLSPGAIGSAVSRAGSIV